MADDRCPTTELLPSDCAHCKGIDLPKPLQRHTGPLFTASYPGNCTGCGDPFDEGDLIRADGDGGYLCSEDHA